MRNNIIRMEHFLIVLLVFIVIAIFALDNKGSTINESEAISVADLWYIMELNSKYTKIDLDDRIKVIYRKYNGHISEATNSSLALAQGDFVAFLDHDDELSPYALYEVVRTLNQNRELDILYSDEDFLDSRGQRVNPHFKSDWNPQLLYSHNYVTHLCVYRMSLVERAGGMRTGVEGAQDYDLLLRCSRLIQRERIYHIPKILYHWRMAAGSTATTDTEKPYTVKAGKKALQDYFESEGRCVEVKETAMNNFYRVEYVYDTPPPLVSIIIPTRDQCELLRCCVESLTEKTCYTNYELLIVDNNSVERDTLNYLEELAEHERINILRYPYVFNYSAINNRAVEECNGEMICLLNNDTEVISSNWLNEMVMLGSAGGAGAEGGFGGPSMGGSPGGGGASPPLSDPDDDLPF